MAGNRYQTGGNRCETNGSDHAYADYGDSWLLPPPSAWAEGERDQVQEGLLVNSGFEATEAGASWSGESSRQIGAVASNRHAHIGSRLGNIQIRETIGQHRRSHRNGQSGSHNPVHPGRGRENVSDQRLGQNGGRQQCRAHPISDEANRHQQCAGPCRNAQRHPRLDVYGEAVHRSGKCRLTALIDR